MRLLLDTCALLWFLTNDPKLSAPAKAAIEDPANERPGVKHETRAFTREAGDLIFTGTPPGVGFARKPPV